MATDDLSERVHALGAWLIGGACSWEVIALSTGKLPPITRLAHRVRRHPIGFAAIAGGLLWLTYHLLLEDR